MDHIQIIHGIWERLNTGAPTSVVLSSHENRYRVKELLDYSSELKNAELIPVYIDCAESPSGAMAFWKVVYEGIWSSLLPYLGDELQLDLMTFSEGIKMADDISDISIILENFLRETDNLTSYRFLLILDRFDYLVHNQDEPEIMILRGITPLATVLSISNDNLEDLGMEKYGNAYYCNQFTPPDPFKL